MSQLLPIWLITQLPTWILLYVVLSGAVAAYAAIRYRPVRQFLAGAFFVSSGILWYLWVTGTTIPIVLPYKGMVAAEPPEVSGERAIVHFVLFLLCFYFGFFGKPRRNVGG
jgi:hypothetical protein